MNIRFAAALLLTLAAADVARADVLPPPSLLEPDTWGIAIVGTVMVGLAISAGVIIGGVIWMRTRKRSDDTPSQPGDHEA